MFHSILKPRLSMAVEPRQPITVIRRKGKKENRSEPVLRRKIQIERVKMKLFLHQNKIKKNPEVRNSVHLLPFCFTLYWS